MTPETRDALGRVTIEAAIIKMFSCPAGITYLFHYVNRHAFRMVVPPNWSSPVGGRDFASCQEAMAAAASAGRFSGGSSTAGAQAYYVYVLDGIGAVIATPQTVQTRRGCEWAGGGPAPCPAAARVLGTLGGPYPSEAAAKADMKTKLDCQQGHWGAFIPYGTGRAWLQNNLGTGDCRTVKQL